MRPKRPCSVLGNSDSHLSAEVTHKSRQGVTPRRLLFDLKESMHALQADFKMKEVWTVTMGIVTLQIDIKNTWASLVVQWLRICLSMQGTWVRALVWEDPTCHGTTKPMHHNY